MQNRLLNTLNQALQISGVNISQASISVEINLGKRAINRRLTAAATTSSAEVQSLFLVIVLFSTCLCINRRQKIH